MTAVPVHPMVVHFPLVLMFLVPIAALLTAWRLRRGGSPVRAWALPAALALALTGSAFVATRTGEAEEEQVEDRVSRRALHTHESAAERFLVLSAALSALSLAGFARGNGGRAARLLTTVGSFSLIAAGVQVGKAGGELVYREGAANAYVDAVHQTQTNRTNAEEADK